MSRRPVPLMYIQSPSVIRQPPIEQEESTSIFVMEESVASAESILEELPAKSKQILPSVKKQLKKIQSPFGRHLYQPVQIKMVDGKAAVGKIEQIEEGQLTLSGEDAETESITIQLAEIIDILWRGKSIPEK